MSSSKLEKVFDLLIIDYIQNHDFIKRAPLEKSTFQNTGLYKKFLEFCTANIVSSGDFKITLIVEQSFTLRWT